MKPWEEEPYSDLYQYWCSLIGPTGEIPHRQEFDALALSRHLAKIQILEYRDGQLFGRLIGGDIVDFAGNKMSRGSPVRDWMTPDDYARTFDALQFCFRNKCVATYLGERVFPDGKSLDVRHLSVPFAGDSPPHFFIFSVTKIIDHDKFILDRQSIRTAHRDYQFCNAQGGEVFREP